MLTHLFVLNLPQDFTESRMRTVLHGCHVTSLMLARTRYGAFASIETASEEGGAEAAMILDAVRLPAPLGIVRGDSRIGQKLGEILMHLTGARVGTYSQLSGVA